LRNSFHVYASVQNQYKAIVGLSSPCIIVYCYFTEFSIIPAIVPLSYFSSAFYGNTCTTVPVFTRKRVKNRYCVPWFLRIFCANVCSTVSLPPLSAFLLFYFRESLFLVCHSAKWKGAWNFHEKRTDIERGGDI
jgi:hypothetical protein